MALATERGDARLEGRTGFSDGIKVRVDLGYRTIHGTCNITRCYKIRRPSPGLVTVGDGCRLGV